MNNFNIVRISSHGEFTDVPLYDENLRTSSSYKDVTFNIYFRGEVGSTVLTRCNTLNTKTINGKLQCSSCIGRTDFHENMKIVYNDKGIVNTTVVNCETALVPDMNLIFDDDDFVNGYALYNTNSGWIMHMGKMTNEVPVQDNGVPLNQVDPDGGKHDVNYVSLNKFKINGIEQHEIKLKDVLNIIYNKLHLKSGSVDIYVSSCLYINPDVLDNIKIKFPEWFKCNNRNIIFGYKRELSDVYSGINKTYTNLQECNDKQQHQETFKTNSQFFIDVLNNLKKEEGFKDYVFTYLHTEENNIIELDELIDEYFDNVGEPDEDLTDLQLLEESQSISDKIIQMIQHRLSSIGSNDNLITKYNDDLYKFKMNRDKLINVIKKCDVNDGEQPAKRIKKGGKKTKKHKMKGGVGTPPNERAIIGRDRWLSDMRRRFQESVQAGQPDMELAQTIMINTPIDPTTVRAIPMTGTELRRQERRQRRTLGRNTIPSISEQTVLPSHYTERTPLVARLLQPGEDISNLSMMRAELVKKIDSLDSPPDSPDRKQHRKEAARDIQRRFRGNRQRRKLTKRRPKYGKLVEPATHREQMRRWMDLSNQFDQDDPVKGYLNPFTKKGGKRIKNSVQMDQNGGDHLETIDEEDYCCDELDICKNDNKRNKRLVNKITKLYEGELLKQMNRGGKQIKRTMTKMRGGVGTPEQSLIDDEMEYFGITEDTEIPNRDPPDYYPEPEPFQEEPVVMAETLQDNIQNDEMIKLKNKIDDLEIKQKICCGDMDKGANTIQKLQRGFKSRMETKRQFTEKYKLISGYTIGWTIFKNARLPKTSGLRGAVGSWWENPDFPPGAIPLTEYKVPDVYTYSWQLVQKDRTISFKDLQELAVNGKWGYESRNNPGARNDDLHNPVNNIKRYKLTKKEIDNTRVVALLPGDGLGLYQGRPILRNRWPIILSYEPLTKIISAIIPGSTPFPVQGRLYTPAQQDIYFIPGVPFKLIKQKIDEGFEVEFEDPEDELKMKSMMSGGKKMRGGKQLEC